MRRYLNLLTEASGKSAAEVLDEFRAWRNAQSAVTIYFSAKARGANLISIAALDIKPQSTGMGTAAMRHLQELCRSAGVAIELEAASANPLPGDDDDDTPAEQQRLEAWYLRLGFEYDGRVGDSGGPMMQWQPSESVPPDGEA